MRLGGDDLRADPKKLQEVASTFREAERAFRYLQALCEDERFLTASAILDGSIDPTIIAAKQAELKGLLSWTAIVESVLGMYENASAVQEVVSGLRRVGGSMA